VHRYPDKVLFLVTSVCPVYCQYCTRSYAVGQDTQLIQKDHVTSAQNWLPALDYIRPIQIEDIVVYGGDLARLKPAHVRTLGTALLEIEHVRRIRLATKVLSVQPMKIVSDHDWTNAVLELVARGRSMFKDVCLHTHFNHPNEVTPIVELAMRRLHEHGLFVRNQTVLLRGVNDDAATLCALIKRLGRINIHPYYVYLCDMVKATEHFRLPLKTAQHLEKQVRGATAGFNTPLFIVDTPSGKRDVHSAEFHDAEYGVSAFVSPAVSAQTCYYYDPVRSLGHPARLAWATPDARASILARITAKAQPSVASLVANATRSAGHRKRIRRSAVPEMRSHAQVPERHDARHCSQPLRAGRASKNNGGGYAPCKHQLRFQRGRGCMQEVKRAAAPAARARAVLPTGHSAVMVGYSESRRLESGRSCLGKNSTRSDTRWRRPSLIWGLSPGFCFIGSLFWSRD
jgi:lysine 2,3-aminomutase